MGMVNNMEKYNFGEKKEEYINGIGNIPVEFHTPKYKEAKAKAIELLDSAEYKDVLKPSDFWILVNTYANKTKAMYSGLIISHDGCLKINDSLDGKLKFNPDCVEIDKEGYNNSLVFSYKNVEQGIFEVGEISKDNCKNDYPYAMALKRCFDRVVLKNSKIAYSGIYSDSESDEFTKRLENDEETDLNERIELGTEFHKLLADTQTDLEKVLKTYGENKNSTDDLTINELKNAITILKKKLTK